ncbi:MAG TPA: hypothetical protein VGD92_11770, partial [Sphingobacteriaceae bacterium]
MKGQLKLSLVHLRSLIGFLKAPALLHAEKGASSRTLFSFCGIGLVLALSGGWATRSLVEAGLLPDPGNHKTEQASPLMLFAGGVVLAPLLEEFLFRMQLRSFTGNLLFTLIIAGVVLSHFLPSGMTAAGLVLLTLTGIFWAIRNWSGKSISRKYMVWRYLFPVNF